MKGKAFLPLFISVMISATNLFGEEKKECDLRIRPIRGSVRHIQGGGIGYDKGYSSLDLFITPYSQKDALLFLDLRGHRFTNGKFASNAGLGFRLPCLDSQLAYGLNVFYDYRRNNNMNFNQVGIGAEILGSSWSIRANSYLPIGNREADSEYSFERFSGNHLHLKRESKRSLTGGDLEGEIRVYSHQLVEAFLAAGPYFYDGRNNHNAFGAKARLTGRFLKMGFLSATASYDRLFRFNFQGEVGLSIALGKKRDTLKGNSLKQHSRECKQAKRLIHSLNRPVQRNEIIAIADQRKTLLAKSAATGAPLHFIHVNNTNPVSGSGTMESPFNTLLSAQNGSNTGDFIYVNAGNNTFLGMDQGFILKESQALLGSGIDQTISTNKGPLSIPAMTPGLSPSITNVNAAGNGVTLANNSVVSGFNISGTPGHGIFSSGVTAGSTIKYNDIIDGGSAGGIQAGVYIQLTPGIEISGTMEVSHNLITSVSGGNDGIFIENDTGNGDTGIHISIHDNNIVGNPSEAIRIERANVMLGSYSLSGDISNNLMQGNSQEGLLVQSTGEGINLNLNVDSNMITTNGDDGIHFRQAKGTLNITNNFAGANVSKGIFIETIGSDSLVGRINGNTAIANTGGVSFEIEANDTSSIDIEFRDNVARSDTMQLDTNNSGVIRASVSGNDGAFNTSGTVILVP